MLVKRVHLDIAGDEGEANVDIANNDDDDDNDDDDNNDNDNDDDGSDDASAHQVPPPLLLGLKSSSLLLKSLSESNKESVCALASSMCHEKRQTNTETDRRTLQNHH